MAFITPAAAATTLFQVQLAIQTPMVFITPPAAATIPFMPFQLPATQRVVFIPIIQ